MIVHCYLTSVALAQLQRALPPPHRVSSSADWNVLIAQIRNRCCDVAVVDPCVGGEHSAMERMAQLTGVASAAPGTPIVGYVSVTAAAIRASHALARIQSSEVVIRGVDDAPEAFAATIHRVIAGSSAMVLISESPGLFESLPPRIARALSFAFHRPERARSVSELASAAHTTRRSLDRCLARSGLAPARKLLSCARVNAAFQLMTVGDVRPASAAPLVGYASARALIREFRAITGFVPSAVPRGLSRDEFVATLRESLRRK